MMTTGDRETRRALAAANRETPEGAGVVVWGCASLLAVAGFLVGTLLRFILH